MTARSFGIRKQDIVVRLRGPVFEAFHYIAEIHWPSPVNSNDNLPQIIHTREEQSRFHLELAVVAGKTAGLSPAVCTLQLAHDHSGCQSISRESLRIQHHPHLPRLSADDRRL